MLFHFLADFTVLIHFLFILFVIFGGLLAFKWWRWALAHLPIVLYAALLEFFGWICPLTPLEKFLRVKGGGITYQTGFIDHYIVPIIYPSLLTHQMKIMLGIAVLILNISIYLMIIWYRTKKKRKKLSSGA